MSIKRNILILPILFSFLHASDLSAQQLVLIGGALKTCSSYTQQHCMSGTRFSDDAKSSRLFQVTDENLNNLIARWPNDENKDHLNRVLHTLKSTNSKTVYSYEGLLNFIKNKQSRLDKHLSDRAWNSMLDELEISPIANNGQRKEEVVFAKRTHYQGSKAILDHMAKAISATPSKQFLAITASSIDPYEASDFYANLLDDYNIAGEWLPLTIPLVQALSQNNCKNLPDLRTLYLLSSTRERVYPERTHQEELWCAKGIAKLQAKIRSVDAIIFNGGDQSLTKQVLFDEHDQPYPWTSDILSRSILVGTSAGTAIQSGGRNVFGKVPMITNGTSEAAIKYGAFDKNAPSINCAEQNTCKDESDNHLTYDAHGGLGSFPYGILDTHFSERSRTLRLATLMENTNQNYGFGIDETTALVVQKQNGLHQFKIIGEHGVVVLERLSSNHFMYHFLQPSDSFTIDKDNKLNLSLADNFQTTSLNSSSVPLSQQDVFAKNGFKKLTQQFCSASDTSPELKLSDDPIRHLRLSKSPFFVCKTRANNYFSIAGIAFSISR